MLNVEIRFLVSGREVSLDSVAAALVGDIRRAVRDEISRRPNQADLPVMLERLFDCHSSSQFGR
jgi:hypothetical protein